MNLVQRVQDILLKPKATWPVIDAEPDDTAALYKNYVMILALIPAVASFIGLSVIGIGAFGVNFRVPIVSGLANMVVGYVLSLVMVFVLALIVDAMAPTFEGTKSQIGAVKVAAYSSTAAFVGGVFSLLPSLSLGALVALYGIYLLYTGLPALMKCPQDKAIAYTAVVVVVCAIVGGFVIAWVLALLTPSPGRIGAASSSNVPAVSIKTPGGELSIDTAKMEEMARKMEATSKQMEKAQASGDSAAAGKAATEILGALTGGGGTPSRRRP